MDMEKSDQFPKCIFLWWTRRGLDAKLDAHLNTFVNMLWLEQDEREDVQKKTFTKWINAQFAKQMDYGENLCLENYSMALIYKKIKVSVGKAKSCLSMFMR
ncbi:hypothetical protein TURU_069754 [Turdus rufiventris]|nr:hypothetical protein TURU_069754 [Turdus rufiventris]